MAPLKKTDIVLMRLIYAPELDPNSAQITNKSSDYPPIGSLGYVNDWAENILMSETMNTPKDVDLVFREWRIVTSNHSLFTIQGFRFNKILIVLGEDKLSYMFYQKPPLCRRFYGITEHLAHYCSCCVGYYHMQIMAPLMKLVATKNIC